MFLSINIIFCSYVINSAKIACSRHKYSRETCVIKLLSVIETVYNFLETLNMAVEYEILIKVIVYEFFTLLLAWICWLSAWYVVNYVTICITNLIENNRIGLEDF